MFLDMLTVVVSSALITAICAVVIFLLRRHARARYRGLGYLAADYALQFACIGLILLRGRIPDFLSIFVANALGMLGQGLMCGGLAVFNGKAWNGRLEFSAAALFSAVFYYFSMVSPSLPARSVLISAFMVLFMARSGWLLLDSERSTKTFSTLLLSSIGGFIIVSLARTGIIFFGHPAHDFFHEPSYDALILLAYSALLVSLTFGIYLMVNRRLLADTIADLAGRVKAETELRASEERFSRAFNSAPMLMSLSEIETGRYIEVNDKFCEVSGFSREELIGKTSVEIGWITAAARGKLIKSSDGNSLRVPELELCAKGGRPVTCSYACEKVRMGDRELLLAIAEDITMLKEAERAHAAAQKLESLGTLAGGIAHDFNNLLTGITGNLSMLERAVNGEGAELVSEALTACRTAKGLARQLLTFSSGGEPVKAPLDLAALAAESVSFSLHGSPVKGRVEGGGDVYALGDREQLFQVMNNLIVNAAQAMPAGGALTVSSGLERVRDGEVPGLPAGDYCRVSVRDPGHGIPPALLGRIFDPYFSTKGKGRGLGLSVCRSIVLKHGGQITVCSEQGKGSTFTVYLPVTAERPGKSAAAPAGPAKGGGRVLVMEDEAIVYKALCRMLSELGYESEVTRHGEEALGAWRKAREAGRPFSAVIMDLTISGGMGGAEAVKELKSLDPSARVIVSSGYSDGAVMSDYSAHGFDGALSKPYQIGELAAALGKVLG